MGLRLPAKVLANLCNEAALAIDHGSLNQDSFSLVPSVASARSRSVGNKSGSSNQLLTSLQCDRTKPCSACCARGHPRECEFIVGEGSDYSPIQQSYEIRKLRQENERLKARLQAARLSHSADEDDDQDSGDYKSKASGRAAAAKQRRFRTGERIDNLYFGTPGLANIVNDVCIHPYTSAT